MPPGLSVLGKLVSLQLNFQSRQVLAYAIVFCLQALSVAELYGVLDTDTRDWTDGLLSNIFREVNKPLPPGKVCQSSLMTARQGTPAYQLPDDASFHFMLHGSSCHLVS